MVWKGVQCRKGERMRKRVIVTVAGGAGLIALGALLARRAQYLQHVRHQVRRAGSSLVRHSRHRIGRWRGLDYRLAGRRPDPDVSDLVLTDRIRSSLGPLEKRLDLPHLHVMVESHTVLLHGEVDSDENLRAVEEAVARISGVVGVESYLHVGLIRGDTRPSEGKSEHPPSEARKRLQLAVQQAGVGEQHATRAVRAVLGTLGEQIPPRELDHVRSHLPADVQSLMQPPRRTGAAFRRVRTVPEFVAEVISVDGVPPASGPEIVEAVLGVLKGLVPEETADVAAVLPKDLRRMWEEAGA